MIDAGEQFPPLGKLRRTDGMQRTGTLGEKKRRERPAGNRSYSTLVLGGGGLLVLQGDHEHHTCCRVVNSWSSRGM